MNEKINCRTCGEQKLQGGSWGLSNLPTCPECGKPNEAATLLREFVMCDAIVNYDSTRCWGCDRPKRDGQHDADCLLWSAEQFLNRLSGVSVVPPASYEQAHEDGESCANADWDFALTEWCQLPDDVDIAPTAIAQYIAKLQGRGPTDAPPA